MVVKIQVAVFGVVMYTACMFVNNEVITMGSTVTNKNEVLFSIHF
jgi:hypothetical protein